MAAEATESTNSLRWCEIAPRCSRERYGALSTAISEAGISNSVEFIEVGLEDFESALAEAKKSFDQIRLGGEFCQMVCSLSTQLPSSLLTLRSADAVVKTRVSQGIEWWPRNFLVDGVSQTVAQEMKTLDFTGSVFIVGANAIARSVAGALVRIGFTKFNITDPHDDVGEQLVADLKGAYFNAQFQFVQRHFITQLPGVHSFGVNTLEIGSDAGILAELFYFNFLRPQGIWLDLAFLKENEALDAEAETVGAIVQSGLQVFARADASWVEYCLKMKLDRHRLVELMNQTRS